MDQIQLVQDFVHPQYASQQTHLFLCTYWFSFEFCSFPVFRVAPNGSNLLPRSVQSDHDCWALNRKSGMRTPSNPKSWATWRMCSTAASLYCTQMAMGQKPIPSVNIPIPTRIPTKMGEFTYQPKWNPKTILTTTAKCRCTTHFSLF